MSKFKNTEAALEQALIEAKAALAEIAAKAPFKRDAANKETAVRHAPHAGQRDKVAGAASDTAMHGALRQAVLNDIAANL